MKGILVILLVSSCAVYAQEDSSLKEDSLSYNAFHETVPFWRMEKNLKFSPFDVLSAVSTVGVDLETKMSPTISFQYGAAFIPTFMQFIVGSDPFQFDYMNGYRLRFESRYYGFKKESRYTAAEFSFRHLIIGDETPIGMEGDEFGNFAYFINEQVTFNRFSTHINTKYGFQKIVSNKLAIDCFIGISFRYNFVFAKQDFPEGGVPQTNWNIFEWTLEDGHAFGYAMPIAGFKMGIHWPAKPEL